jgi:hypothetical protein
MLGIVTDKAHVYWIANSNQDGLIFAGSKDGGAPTLLASGQQNPFAIAVNGTNVYWTLQGPNNPPTTNGQILSAPLDGGIPWVLQDGGSDPTDGGWGRISVLANQQYLPNLLVVDSANVYWTTWGDEQPGHGTVMQASLGGPEVGAPITLATDHLPFALAIDGSFVYWATLTDPGVISKVPIGGGTPVTLASRQHTPQGIAVDDTFVYWTATGTQTAGYMDGQIMKAPK